MNTAFDMETSDPDDVLTLCLLCTHSAVALRAVTVTPGSRAQVGLVRHVLQKLGRADVPVGAARPGHPKDCVSSFHHRWLGQIAPADPDALGGAILLETLRTWPDTTVITGAALSNVSAAISMGAVIRNAFVQGGFAGDGVVPAECRLEKFRGRETCATYNLNGDVPAAKHVLESPHVLRRHLVSKNVCHGVIYDRAMHGRMSAVRATNPGFELMRDGMARYLAKNPSGKAFHDPLAAMTAVDPGICRFVQVRLYRERGEWGSRPADDSDTFISVGCDRERFERVLAGSS